VDVYLFVSRRDFLIRSSCLTIIFGALAPAQQSQQSNDKTQQTAKSSAAKSSASDSGAKQGADDPVYEPGKDVKPPKLVHYVEPEFSPSSKEAFVEGTVKISTVVTRDGIPTELKVVRGLNAKEDETAMDALKQWRFQPGTKEGEPVRVRVTVEVDFHLL
jgi:TonB family protein